MERKCGSGNRRLDQNPPVVKADQKPQTQHAVLPEVAKEVKIKSIEVVLAELGRAYAAGFPLG